VFLVYSRFNPSNKDLVPNKTNLPMCALHNHSGMKKLKVSTVYMYRYYELKVSSIVLRENLNTMQIENVFLV